MALSGHAETALLMSAFDPKATSGLHVGALKSW
jgi:hypothetical protein